MVARGTILMCVFRVPGIALSTGRALARFSRDRVIPSRHAAATGLKMKSCPAAADATSEAHKAQNIAKNNLWTI